MENKIYKYKKRFKFKEERNEYVFQLRKRNWKWLWWLLLLLLILLLFVKCERDINVHTVDYTTNEDLPYVDVTIDYTAHYLYKDGTFFANEGISRNLQTDDCGKGTFEDLPCSVFSYIFYAFSKIVYNAEEDCYKLRKSPESSLFHYTWNKKLNMVPKTIDVDLRVVDRETLEELADATVIYHFTYCGESFEDTVKTTPAGVCTIKGAPLCGDVFLRRASCYGYADTMDVNINVPVALAYPDSALVKLTPLKQSFSYFVKNKFTKEPVPGATVEVILTSGNGKVLRGKSTTNVDGKGLGVYEDAFVLAQLELKATKKHYKPGTLDKKYTVEQFAALPDSARTIYLEPEPYMEKFQNVDSLTGVPIAGVTNEIHIKSISGKDDDFTETSNRNGIFYVKALEGDRIEINSELSPFYFPKNTLIESFEQGEIIKMRPNLVDLVFRTVDGETGEILPECTLNVSSSRSNVSIPTSSGNGVFTVKNLFVGEKLSIVASKTHYTTNSTKVRNAKVIELMNSAQERRDIPLNLELPPCDAGATGQSNVAAGTVSIPKSYNMGVNSGTFTIKYDTQNVCSDRFQIYNHKPGEEPTSGVLILDTGQVVTAGDVYETLSFSNGSVITVVVTTGNSSGSGWSYHISCPD